VGEVRQDIMAKEDIIPMTDLEEGGGEEVDFQIFALYSFI
jgi:hypothetical protein